MSEVTVSVICQTYQHASYIRDALNGFLAQKTNFKFEIIIRDDCSNDGTTEIIKEYERKYPGIIRGIYEPFNKWPSVKPGVLLRQAATGKYIAECEGDDYWIDEYKLQKQVDYLETHKNTVLLKTHCVWIENGRVIKPNVAGGTRTHVFKNIKVPFDYISYVYFGDTYYQAMLVEHGDFAILNDVTAVWRKHSEGVFGSIADDRKRPLNLHRSQTQMWISQQFFDDGQKALANRYMANSIQVLLSTLKVSEIVSIIRILLYSSIRKVVGKSLRFLKLIKPL
ncbi:glycosyltransferase [Idiomarina loihiensis]|uniref:glycosyltransferase n=1 Tax=Idiomarina loihiensis TaxID=135577 RepID=UPI0018926AD9|nr:glycosyltransferase [Idiomarina loihiensis]UTW32139.1 glycosyltransferase [Idiomarina loihiensis]